MPIVKTMMDDKTYSVLVAMRKKEGMPSVSALFLKKCDVLDDEREATEIVRRAFKILQKKSSGYEFRLCDLFPTSQWKAWNRGARLRAGRLFYAKVAAATRGVRAGNKSASGHQKYILATTI